MSNPKVFTSSLMQDIADFHGKFELNGPEAPMMPTPEVFEYRLRFIMEEVDELTKAYAAGDLVEFTDALVDIVYVVLGTAYLAGIPFDACWDEVHHTNMQKERAPDAAASKRGTQLDVIKPSGWVKPAIADILRGYGAEL